MPFINVSAGKQWSPAWLAGLVIALVIGLTTELPIKPQTLANLPSVLSKSVNAHAQVKAEYFLNSLTGYTSPYAEVNLSSINLARKTQADGTGLFAFYNIPIVDRLGELCLVAQDVNQLPSFPTCLPPPDPNRSLDMRDVLLSPTISLDSREVLPGQTVKASGLTFPHAPVQVYFFSVNDYSVWLWLRRLFTARPAHAFALPALQTKSNADGWFEFSLPASTPSHNRVYVAAALGLGLTQDQKTKGARPADPPNSKIESPAEDQAVSAYLTFQAQAAEADAKSSLMSLSPKSNVLYFQALGWWGRLQRLLAQLLSQALNFFQQLANSGIGLLFLEFLVVLFLISVVLVKKLKEEPSYFSGR